MLNFLLKRSAPKAKYHHAINIINTDNSFTPIAHTYIPYWYFYTECEI